MLQMSLRERKNEKKVEKRKKNLVSVNRGLSKITINPTLCHVIKFRKMCFLIKSLLLVMIWFGFGHCLDLYLDEIGANVTKLIENGVVLNWQPSFVYKVFMLYQKGFTRKSAQFFYRIYCKVSGKGKFLEAHLKCMKKLFSSIF